METFCKVMHQWCVPLFHMLLWAAGLYTTVNVANFLSNILPLSISTTAFSLWMAVILFSLEIIVTLIDIVLKRDITRLHITIFLFIALFIFIFILANIATIFQFIPRYQIKAGIYLILFSSGVKGMEIWLQNNIDKFNIDILQGEKSYQTTPFFNQVEEEQPSSKENK